MKIDIKWLPFWEIKIIIVCFFVHDWDRHVTDDGRGRRLHKNTMHVCIDYRFFLEFRISMFIYTHIQFYIFSNMYNASIVFCIQRLIQLGNFQIIILLFIENKKTIWILNIMNHYWTQFRILNNNLFAVKSDLTK